ncbi:MAG: bifunctional riboflavin kinase/FAD synthetase [Flavobacteriales bacterium]|nr:bifunctional riboflavin kinase/FAD synthetase [Flavobacteriales bacterium]MCW8912834.1 bifunctional riboflavin kinase/FAD synthetase [Flavobacteriales bacterium]MCW8937183.1 bifunctional riboflavin kinase/FAD synthetase [Flavobacteriales bacterium]MCW8969544.1 bifunctional riboflavin kinase/FAD synthetase [Flavobacteriales bacterium]MCW8989861.1 bifunctional riboflavin kinase/FAD synthetase [Flavobacteriales bacterium]
MKVYTNIQEFKSTKNVVVTIGTFDGVHLGHKVIINQLKKAAEELEGESVLLTFFPHPRMVVFPDDNELKLLNTIGERKELLEKAGVDHLIIHPFSKAFSRLTALEFVRDILVNRLNVKKVVIGYDHHFGRNREGAFEDLVEFGEVYGFVVEEIPAQDIQQINVSSTKIRTSLLAGEIHAATQFLGYPYFINGTVVKGDKIGREIGFPTANIKPDETYKLIPKNGVYAVKVIVNEKEYEGMLNIGIRPTLKGKKETIEVNIFDFDEDIYGQKIQVKFYERIRDEQFFEDLNELKNQLNIDKTKTIQLFS